nr:OadG family protein [Clostridioides sp.]
MNLRQLLEALKDPSATVSLGDKLLAGISVAIISIVVVFIVLILISGIISLLQRLTDKTKKINEETKTPDAIPDHNEQEDNAELVAVITAAIATQTGKSANNILVKKVVRSNNYKTSWENMKNNTNRY